MKCYLIIHLEFYWISFHYITLNIYSSYLNKSRLHLINDNEATLKSLEQDEQNLGFSEEKKRLIEYIKNKVRQSLELEWNFRFTNLEEIITVMDPDQAAS